MLCKILPGCTNVRSAKKHFRCLDGLYVFKRIQLTNHTLPWKLKSFCSSYISSNSDWQSWIMIIIENLQFIHSLELDCAKLFLKIGNKKQNRPNCFNVRFLTITIWKDWWIKYSGENNTSETDVAPWCYKWMGLDGYEYLRVYYHLR